MPGRVGVGAGRPGCRGPARCSSATSSASKSSQWSKREVSPVVDIVPTNSPERFGPTTSMKAATERLLRCSRFCEKSIDATDGAPVGPNDPKRWPPPPSSLSTRAHHEFGGPRAGGGCRRSNSVRGMAPPPSIPNRDPGFQRARSWAGKVRGGKTTVNPTPGTSLTVARPTTAEFVDPFAGPSAAGPSAKAWAKVADPRSGGLNE